jgi:uncharacterized protein YdbL (DUF1318 family)
MTRLITATLTAACLSLAACVTINVYFPAAAAEKAADRIIEDVWGKDKEKPAKDGGQSSLLPMGGGERRVLLAAAGGLLDLVIPRAEAQADLDISSPAIRALTAQMESRHAQLEPHYASGAIGLTANGLVELRDPNAVPLPERALVRKLLSDDNADRNALYAEIARANGHPEWEADVRTTFAQRWIAKARPGWWYRNAAGQWAQK